MAARPSVTVIGIWVCFAVPWFPFFPCKYIFFVLSFVWHFLKFWKILFCRNFAVSYRKTSNFDGCLLDFIYTCHFCFIKEGNWPHCRLQKFCRSSIYVPENVWKLPVKEFGYSKVAGLYQFFPKKSADS